MNSVVSKGNKRKTSDPSSKESFGRRLKRLRLSKRFSLKEMAHKLNVPATTYREWEYGRAIQGEPYIQIAEALGVNLVELLTGEKPSKLGIFKELEALERHLVSLRKEFESFLV